MDIHRLDNVSKNIPGSFSERAAAIVEKYCSITLPYKPGLYSIYWESMYRISGLLDELHTAANDLQPASDCQAIPPDIEEVIHRSLLQYIEQIYGAEYADAGQPAWMLHIAQRLQLYTPLRSMV